MATTYSDVFIDDTRLQDLGITVLLESSEPALPSVTNTSETVPGRHGAVDFGGWLEPRVFVIRCMFQRQSYPDLKTAIRKLNRLLIDEFGKMRTFRLRFGDDPDVYYNVRLTSEIPVERVAGLGIFEMEFTAFDPFGYTTATIDEVLWGSETVYFTAAYPMGLGDSGPKTVTDPITLSRYVDGLSVRPIITIDGTASSITLTCNGKSISFGAFTDASIVIDCEKYRVTKDGVSAFKSMTGDFFTLKTGENVVDITGTNLNVIINVTYQNKFA